MHKQTEFQVGGAGVGNDHGHGTNARQMQQLQQQQQLHQMNELSNQLGCISPQHDRYILNTLQHFHIMQQQHQHQQLGSSGNGVASTFAMNAAVRDAQLQQQQQQEELHKTQLALLMENVCSKDAPVYPPPPIEVHAGACTVDEQNITSNDVLAGRGNRVNNHAGNVRFREMVKPFKVLYLQKTTKKLTKAQMCAVVVSYVRTHYEPQGRFLEKDPVSQRWVEIGDEKARKKAGQALREDATVIRAELGMEKPGNKGKAKDSSTHNALVKAAGKESSAKKQEVPEAEDDHKNIVLTVSSGGDDVLCTTGSVELEKDPQERGYCAADVPVTLPLEVSISPIISTSSKRGSHPSSSAGTSHFITGIANIATRSGSSPAAMGKAMSMAASRSDSSSSMMSSATAVIANLSSVTGNVNVHCQARADANTIAAQDAVLEEEETQVNNEEEDQELLLKQKKRLLMSQRKHRPNMGMLTPQDKVSSQRRLAVTSPQETSISPEETETLSPLVGLRVLRREPSFKRGSDSSFDVPLVTGEQDNECPTTFGRHLLVAGAGNNPNASVPRLDVSNRTIQSMAQENMDGDDSDGDNSIDLQSDQEDKASRLYSKTPSKQRLIVKKKDLGHSCNLTMEEDDALKASAAAANAFGQSGSSSGSGSNNSCNAGPSPKRRPSQASVSLRRSIKGHANRSSITGKQRRKSSICMNDLIQSIDNASKNGDQRNSKSMFDSSMTMSSFGNSALSSTNWNTSHGNMSLADFSFTQVLHELVDDDFEDSEDEDEGVQQQQEYNPRTARCSATVTSAGAGSFQTSSGSSMHQSQSQMTTHSLSMSMSCASMASHSSSSHSAIAYL